MEFDDEDDIDIECAIDPTGLTPAQAMEHDPDCIHFIPEQRPLSEMLPHGTEVTLVVAEWPVRVFKTCVVLHDNNEQVHFFPKERCN